MNLLSPGTDENDRKDANHHFQGLHLFLAL